MTKYPKTSTKMRRDALALKRAVALLADRVAVARTDCDGAKRVAVSNSACEVARLAMCIHDEAVAVYRVALDQMATAELIRNRP